MTRREGWCSGVDRKINFSFGGLTWACKRCRYIPGANSGHSGRPDIPTSFWWQFCSGTLLAVVPVVVNSYVPSAACCQHQTTSQGKSCGSIFSNFTQGHFSRGNLSVTKHSEDKHKSRGAQKDHKLRALMLCL